jgi:chorismate mutase
MISPRLLLLSVYLSVSLLLTAFPSSGIAAVGERLNPLVTLMIQRLQLSREVAWSKCLTGIPVADPVREARMLTDLKAAGRQ